MAQKVETIYTGRGVCREWESISTSLRIALAIAVGNILAIFFLTSAWIIAAIVAAATTLSGFTATILAFGLVGIFEAMRLIPKLESRFNALRSRQNEMLDLWGIRCNPDLVVTEKKAKRSSLYHYVLKPYDI